MTVSLTQAPESLFWYWMAERHAIYLRRQAGLPKPWTTDPILQEYKFTNPFRENDRGTVWLRENFIKPHWNDSPELLAFNIAWYRMFNWWGTGELLGWITDWDEKRVIDTLTTYQQDEGRQIFTGAHIVYSRPGLSKIDAITKVCSAFWNLRKDIASHCLSIHSLELTHDFIQIIDSVGGFMAYEIVSDYRHTPLLQDATDIYTWANPGPGAIRGLKRLGLAKTANRVNAIEKMRELLGRGKDGLFGFAFDDLWNGIDKQASGIPALPALEMRDIEHSLCEFDKYCRVKFGEGAPRSKFDGRG